MTRRAHRATLNAIVVALVTLVLVLGSGLLASPGSAASDPKRPHKQARKHTPRARQEAVSRGLRAVQIANQLTGVPYRWGGASPGPASTAQVSSSTCTPRSDQPAPLRRGQYGHGRRVSRGSLRAGDLVFFSGLGHVGIYAGGGKFIHAPRRGTTVRWSQLSSHGSYYGATRLAAA